MALATQGQSSDCALGRLYDKCEAVLGVLPADTPATQTEVDAIAPFMDAMTPGDLRITPPTSTGKALGRLLGGGRFVSNRNGISGPSYLPLEYLLLHDSPQFTMGVFSFPKHGFIPLHDHPGMTVVSKLLYGRVRVRSFDWVEAEDGEDDGGGGGGDGEKDTAEKHGSNQPRLARLVADRETQAPTSPLALFPHDANIHTFHAVTACALLDVLHPPYAVGGGRDCHYFMEVECGPNGETCARDEAWLLEIECPDQFIVHRGHYRGPRVGSEAR